MEAALNQMKALFTALLHDVVEARKRIKQDYGEHSKRAYVRAFFALVEGRMSSMKSVSLATAKTLRVALSDAESALLKEESYDLKQSGEPRLTRKFLGTVENFRFANTMYASILHCSHQIDYSAHGWQEFQNALEIRHRLTHPKKAVDLQISTQDYETIRAAAAWYAENMRKLIQSSDLDTYKKKKSKHTLQPTPLSPHG